MLNVGSLILGVCAWLFGGLALFAPNRAVAHRNTVVSFVLCVLSLVLQLFEIDRRVLIGDYAAVEDTIRAVLIASVVLTFVTVILNLAAEVKAKRK